MTNINIDPVVMVAIISIFAVIPIVLFGSIQKIVASVQRRKIAEAYARQGMALPAEEQKPKKIGDVVMVRALALIGVALGLGLGLIWDDALLTVALIIGCGGLGMLGGWFAIRSQEHKGSGEQK